MIKKLIVLSIAIFVNNNPLIAQEKSLVDEILKLTKERSIYKDNVDWEIVHKKVKNEVDREGDSPFEMISPAVGVLLDELNDKHSFIQYKDKTVHKATPVHFLETINEKTKNALKNTDQQKINTFQFDSNIGYIQIPSMTGSETISNKELAQILRDSLCGLDIQNLKGILVDLRLNTGGDMWPMISGVAPLLGDGVHGYFMLEGKPINNWRIKKGKVYEGNRKRIKIKNNCPVNKDIKIALLIGPATGSSGEMTAISFLGKPNTKSFGERTAGYVTANNKIKLRDNLYYFLSSSYVADHNKKEYRKAIDPDVEIIDGDNYDDLLQDKKVSEALKWIRKK